MRSSFAAIACSACLIGSSGGAHGAVLPASRGAAAVAVTPIQHIVIIQKENRSFDEYFGQFPGADGATSGTMSNGQVVQLGQTPDPMPNDIKHTPQDWAKAYDGGKMDGFDKEQGAFSKTGQNLAYSQMSQSQIPNYWAYAQTYALGDRMFAPWKGGSFPNNVFAVAAQTGQYDPTLNFGWMYGNSPVNSTTSLKAWGCDDPAGTIEMMMNPDGSTFRTYPCFGFQALPNELSSAGVSWKFYNDLADGAGFKHNGLDAIGPVRNDPSLWSNVVSRKAFFTDAQAGNLPAVSWVIGQRLEHPPSTACAGENETVQMVNAIMSGPDWPSTAIFIYWDEWGGFYDHVAPPQIDGVSYGFRVPLLIISPYTKVGPSANGGSIDDTTFSALSLLKTIEGNWSLPSLTPKDAAANDMLDAFDFTAPPRPKLLLTPRTCPTLTAAERRLARTENPD